MGRLKGSKNKTYQKNSRPLTSKLTLEERLQVLANLIVDRIIEEQQNGKLSIKTQSTK